MKNYLPYILTFAVVIAVDLYVFKSLRLLTFGWVPRAWRMAILTAYWFVNVGVYAWVVYAVVGYRASMRDHDYFMMYMAFGALISLLVPKLIVAVFHMFDDVIQLVRTAARWLGKSESRNLGEAVRTTTRRDFLTTAGWVVAAIPFAGMLYGIIRGRFQFRVERQTLHFPHLPTSFDGLKIVQLSDIHIGSFFSHDGAVQRGIDMVNELDPDLILFTGDMVNNFAEELDGWEEVLGSLKAKMGKYAVLGNHDYGDYAEWPSAEARLENLERLKKREADLGFELLNNAWVPLRSAAGEEIELIGSENWGAGRFSKYGDLQKAMKGTRPERLQILMTHDPSHWDAQVRGDTSVDLTLSGHTHGMQFGLEIPGFIKWSPAQYRYKRWGGLYREGKQMLYVNRGFGYIGYPGRFGIWPEITLLELKKG